VAFAAEAALATVDPTGRCRLWIATSGHIPHISAAAPTTIHPGALSLRGSLLAVGDKTDGTVGGVWNVATRKKTLSLRTYPTPK